MTNDEWSIEWLTGFAAEIKQTRLEAFKASIELAHRAKTMGPGAVKAVSPYLGWTAQTVNRLAGLKALLDDEPELIDPEVPLGCYWYLLQKHEDQGFFDIDVFKHWVRQCIHGHYSLGQLKELRGEKREREIQEPWYEGEMWGNRNQDGSVVFGSRKFLDSQRVHVRAVEVSDDPEG